MIEELAAHLASGGYHPRSQKHSDFQSLIIIRDLVAQCPILSRRAAAGEIVAKMKHHQQVGHADWVIDIAIGTCAGAPAPPTSDAITFGPPVIIQIAIELKSVFTEHKKARLNRVRDFNAFHGFAHQYDPKTVAAAFVAVNSAERFYSPLRRPDDITVHGSARVSARQLAKNIIDDFRSIHLRNSADDSSGLEALGAIAIEHDNLVIHPDPPAYAQLHKPTQPSPIPPNPALGDPLHYQSMIQRICNAYMQRFS